MDNQSIIEGMPPWGMLCFILATASIAIGLLGVIVIFMLKVLLERNKAKSKRTRQGLEVDDFYFKPVIAFPTLSLYDSISISSIESS